MAIPRRCPSAVRQAVADARGARLHQETGCLPPHRIVPLHQFRVGQWYPFRDFQATISDPKTTASVGAMICLLGEGQLQNFNFRSDALKFGSTAQYFGKLDRKQPSAGG